MDFADHKPHVGHLIILDSLALETLQIFKTLYQNTFPLSAWYYHPLNNRDIWKSTEHDNTLGFFCRRDDQNSDQIFKHSYGIAIDINQYNPAPVSIIKPNLKMVQNI